MDYESVSGMTLECKECHKQWFWPRPYKRKKIYPPDHCPECRNKEIELLKKHIELLNEIHDKQIYMVKLQIERLTPHYEKEYCHNNSYPS